MKNESHIEALDQQDISEVELNNVIDANKDLYDKLNELPEIEALDSLVEEEGKRAGIKNQNLQLIYK